MTTCMWQYRIVRDHHEGQPFYTIREVYFEGDQVASWTAEGVDPFGETREEIFQCLADMMGATVRFTILDLTGEKPELISNAEADRRDGKRRIRDAETEASDG